MKLLMGAALTATMAFTVSAQAQVQQFYGADGSYRGLAMPSGSSALQFYDGQGNHTGTALKAGNNTMLYDGQGNYAGTVTNSGQIFGNE